MSVCSLPLGEFRTNRPGRNYTGGVLPSHKKLVADWEQRRYGLCIRSQAALCLGDTATVCGHGWFVTDVKHRPYLVAGYLASFVYDCWYFSVVCSSFLQFRSKKAAEWSDPCCLLLNAPFCPSMGVATWGLWRFWLFNWRMLCLLAHVNDADETIEQMSWVRVGLCIKDCFENHAHCFLLVDMAQFTCYSMK